MNMIILEAHNVRKTYALGKAPVPVLRGVSLAVSEGESVAILGRSGSGKSTLLHLLGGLDTPDAAGPGEISTIKFRERSLTEYSGSELDAYRNRSVGMVFQFYHLFPELPVIENVLIAAMVGRGRLGYMKERDALVARAEKLLDRVGLSTRMGHRPSELSGGERQRVAIARALINEPPLLLADEPTGNLDRQTGAQILDLLEEIQRESRQTMVIVTHDATTAGRADRVVTLADGQVVAGSSDSVAASQVPAVI